MGDLILTPEPQETKTEFFLATVYSSSSSGVRFTIDGDTQPTTRGYKMLLTGQSLSASDRVIVMKQSGTYVVFGKIGNPT